MEGIPDLSEELMVNRDLLINKYHEGRLHFNILSSKKSLELIEVSKKTQNNLSCGTSIFHLLFDDEIINQFDNIFKIYDIQGNLDKEYIFLDKDYIVKKYIRDRMIYSLYKINSEYYLLFNNKKIKLI